MASDGSNLGQGLSSAMEIGVGCVVGYYGGDWIDKKFGTGPWGLLVCVVLGCGAGLYLVLKEMNRIEAARKRDRGSNDASGGDHQGQD